MWTGAQGRRLANASERSQAPWRPVRVITMAAPKVNYELEIIASNELTFICLNNLAFVEGRR